MSKENIKNATISLRTTENFKYNVIEAAKNYNMPVPEFIISAVNDKINNSAYNYVSGNDLSCVLIRILESIRNKEIPSEIGQEIIIHIDTIYTLLIQSQKN